MSDEGNPERPGRVSRPHLLVPWRVAEQAYRGRDGGAPKPIRQIGDQRGHAEKLTGELESARDAAREKLNEVDLEIAADGFGLSVESWPDELQLQARGAEPENGGISGTGRLPIFFHAYGER
jgi:hypothetical protein